MTNTDPDTDQVWMGARWYQPGTATFTSRDTVFGMLKTPVSLNRYTYGNGDPLQYFDPDGRFGLDTFKKAANSAWNNTGGKAVTAVNRSVVQPVLRSAAIEAVKSTTATLTRTIGKAGKSGAQFVRRNAKTIVRTGAVIAAAGATFVGCSATAGVATAGVAVVGCGAAAGAVGGAVNAAFDCPGQSAAACAKGVAIGTASGGAAGAVASMIGAAGAGGALVRAVAAGAGAGATHSVTSQGLSTGRINLNGVGQETVLGGITGGLLHGAGTAMGSVRGVRTPSAAEPASAPNTALGSSTDLVRVADFADDAAAFGHYSKHVKGIEFRPNGGYRLKPGGADVPELGSFGEYRNAARGFMSPDAPPGVFQGYRGTDLLRVDPKTDYFGVRSQEGLIRTFFRPDGDPVAYFWGQL